MSGTSATNEKVAENKIHQKFDADTVIHKLQHYLPAQAPLKDFVHHNTLHAFQDKKFSDALSEASKIFGYKTYLSLEEFREHYWNGKIKESTIERIITEHKGIENIQDWKTKLIHDYYDTSIKQRIGTLRSNWKNEKQIDLDALVHPILFRILCSYLDQGVAAWEFPVKDKKFLEAIKELETKSISSFFKHDRARKLLLEGNHEIENLLRILIADENLFEHYLFDLQFAHQGWSGIVASIENLPEGLLDKRRISTKELIIFELLLEIDALDEKFGKEWYPLGVWIPSRPGSLFDPVLADELKEVYSMWQEAFEWSFYDQTLNGILSSHSEIPKINTTKTFQAYFCIDDRECSIRRYIEQFDPYCETFSTAGFFGVEFYYQPDGGKHLTKLCPAPVTPKYLIKEVGSKSARGKDLHFSKPTQSLLSGYLISQTLGYWSAIKLFFNIIRPSLSPAVSDSFKHMDKFSNLTIDASEYAKKEFGLQVGYTHEEMANRVEGVLRSTGLVKDFAQLIYMIGHGASSVNNPHYTAYDCGACCGRPGSVNARVFSMMANKKEVRNILSSRGINIPDSTQFIGGLHDTTRDEMQFFDVKSLNEYNLRMHKKNELVFDEALSANAKERSRRFSSINTKRNFRRVHRQVKKRSVSLFEPRPELNHATNALCIVGRRSLTKELFLDRRAFMNSFDYRVDPEGKYLLNILNAAAPVCGGINLEYFFSRVDNQKLGAGTKLPHNVMGLFGVANGYDGDLRPGLPSQMIEVHDPLRLLIIVEHFPYVVLNTIKTNPATYEWFINEWVNLVVLDPDKKEFYRFKDGQFEKYNLHQEQLKTIDDVESYTEREMENLPIAIIKQARL